MLGTHSYHRFPDPASPAITNNTAPCIGTLALIMSVFLVAVCRPARGKVPSNSGTSSKTISSPAAAMVHFESC